MTNSPVGAPVGNVAARIRQLETQKNSSNDSQNNNKPQIDTGGGLRGTNSTNVSAAKTTPSALKPVARHSSTHKESTTHSESKHTAQIAETSRPKTGRVSNIRSTAKKQSSSTQSNASGDAAKPKADAKQSTSATQSEAKNSASANLKSDNNTSPETLEINKSPAPIAQRLQTDSGKQTAGQNTLAQINHLRQNPEVYADLIESKITYQGPSEDKIKEIFDSTMLEAKNKTEAKGKTFKGKARDKAFEKATTAVAKYKDYDKKEFDRFEKKHGPSLRVSIKILRDAAKQNLQPISWKQSIFDDLKPYTNQRANNKTPAHSIDKSMTRKIMTDGQTPGKSASYKENDYRSQHLTELDAVIGWAEDEGGALIKFSTTPKTTEAAQKKYDAQLESWVKNYGGDISTLNEGDTLKDENGNSLKSNDLSKGHLLNMVNPDIVEAAVSVDIQPSSGNVAYVYSARGEQ